MQPDLVQVCIQGIWQKALLIAFRDDFIVVEINWTKIPISNGQWALLW